MRPVPPQHLSTNGQYGGFYDLDIGPDQRLYLAVGSSILRSDPDAPDPGNSSCMSGSFDHAIIRVAAIQIRAIALALGHDVQGESLLSPDLVLSNEETAFALAS